jgi:hypothetical protein
MERFPTPCVFKLSISSSDFENCDPLSKDLGFHGCDNEERHLLGYKIPVRTSQETHYVSATQHNRSMLCKISGFHSDDNEVCGLLG